MKTTNTDTVRKAHVIQSVMDPAAELRAIASRLRGTRDLTAPSTAAVRDERLLVRLEVALRAPGAQLSATDLARQLREPIADVVKLVRELGTRPCETAAPDSGAM